MLQKDHCTPNKPPQSGRKLDANARHSYSELGSTGLRQGGRTFDVMRMGPGKVGEMAETLFC